MQPRFVHGLLMSMDCYVKGTCIWHKSSHIWVGGGGNEGGLQSHLTHELNTNYIRSYRLVVKKVKALNIQHDVSVAHGYPKLPFGHSQHLGGGALDELSGEVLKTVKSTPCAPDYCRYI